MSKNHGLPDTQVTGHGHAELEDERMAAEDDAARARARLALKQMPPRTLRIFTASQVEGLRYAEIARREHMTLGRVRRHMRFAIRIIAQNMA